MLVLITAWNTGCRSRTSGAEEVFLEEQTGGLAGRSEKGSGKPDSGSGKNQEESDLCADPKETEAEAHPSGSQCTVYVCGAVNVPGVYELPAGSRVYEALDAAGGTCPEADPVYLNRAEEIQDGQQIYVPTAEEAKELGQPGAAGTGGIVPGAKETQSGAGGKVNLNTASKEELMTLTGIGEAKAESIMAYREEHGRFTSVEELMQIPGIKEGVFRKIRDSITVT